MGENNFASLPVAVYGVDLFFAAVAFAILIRLLIQAQGSDTRLRDAVGRDSKGKLSLLLYAAAVALAFPARLISLALFVVVALMWLAPDPRIERVHSERGNPSARRGDREAK